MTERERHAGRWHRHITSLMVAGELGPDAVDTVIEAGLAAYAIERTSQRSGAVDPRLNKARLVATARHAAIRRATVDLVRAWDRVGIDALLFKGFYLAEFVYPDPSWRPYSDVDVVLRSRTDSDARGLASRAATAARQHGFDVVWHFGETEEIDSFHDHAYDGHELLQLVHAATGVNVDVHRRLVHSNVSLRPQADTGEAVTSRVWDAAAQDMSEGVPVYVPAPVDSALVGLILARSWSGDRHALRPHDPLDLDALMRFGAFDRTALMARARELGLSATTRLFLRRCDLENGRLDVSVPSPLRAFAYDTLLLSERGHRGLAQWSAAVAAGPGRYMAIVRELPAAMRQRQLHAAGHPLRRLPDDTGADARPLDRRTWRASQVAVRRALKLVGLDPDQHTSVAVASLHASMVQRGYAVTSRSDGARERLEYQGRALPLDQLVSGAGESVPAGSSGPARRVGWSGIALRLEALVLLRRIASALESRSFQEVRSSLIPDVLSARSEQDVSGQLDGAVQMGRAVASAARFVPGALCVPQALATQVMLTRRNVPSTIHFGFLRSRAGAVEGHAWLDVGGAVVIGDGALDDFTRTATFEA